MAGSRHGKVLLEVEQRAKKGASRQDRHWGFLFGGTVAGWAMQPGFGRQSATTAAAIAKLNNENPKLPDDPAWSARSIRPIAGHRGSGDGRRTQMDPSIELVTRRSWRLATSGIFTPESPTTWR